VEERIDTNTRQRIEPTMPLVHPPIIIGLALALRGFHAAALTKAAMLTLAAAMATYAFSAIMLRRLAVLSRIP
jgi:hypothetical protein